MGQIKNLREVITEANKAIRLLIDGVKDQIINLPDNPNAQRISKNIVIVNSRHLSNKNWSAEYYNFKWQYEAIALYISDENAHPEQLLKRIEKILVDGEVPRPYYIHTIVDIHHYSVDIAPRFDHKSKQKLHHDVIANLKNIFEVIDKVAPND